MTRQAHTDPEATLHTPGHRLHLIGLHPQPSTTCGESSCVTHTAAVAVDLARPQALRWSPRWADLSLHWTEPWLLDGHARCECGAESPHLRDQAARWAWHRKHVTAALAA